VNVEVSATLTRLSKEGRVSRIRIGRKYLYGSTDSETLKRQCCKKRDNLPADWGETMSAVTQTFLQTLSERNRRLFAGWFSLYLGDGGDQQSAQLLKMSRSTVAQGRKQILTGEFEKDQLRSPSGGRHL